MSFLTPLYLAGLLGVSLPILLHLIRRSPEGRKVFSSLMFLSPSPPRLSRRSRIEHWLLLALRAAALILLALAFGRPFLRSEAQLNLASIRGRRIALLMDVSASMRRPAVWRQAVRQANQILDELEPADRVGVIAFDEQPKLLQGWSESDAQENGVASVAQARLVLEELEPGWWSTDLGGALAFAADALVEANDRAQSDAAMQVVVISDMQQGARVEALQAYDWPENVQAAFHTVAANNGNAVVRVAEVADASLEDAVDQSGARFRLRLANSADAKRETFKVYWANEQGPLAEEVAVSAPAGETRVVGLPAPPPGADRVVLAGDDSDFDNTFYFAATPEQELEIGLFMDDAPEDPLQLRFYLEAALENQQGRRVQFVTHRLDQTVALSDLKNTDLVVIRDAISNERCDLLRQWLNAGGTTLWVLADPAGEPLQQALRSLLQSNSLEAADAPVEPYCLFAEVDFRHPVFARLASPQYSDFTEVRFWGHRRLTASDEPWQVVARFDDGDPAVLDATIGQGRLIVLAAGWRPEESQLARVASKFIPFMEGVASMTQRDRWSPESLIVGETVALPALAEGNWRIRGPGVKAQESQDSFVAVQPGMYQAEADIGDEPRTVNLAVNLMGEESDTAARDPNELEPMGVAIGKQVSQTEKAERTRHLQDVELEGRQKLWQWALAAVLGLLIIETWLAARTARQAQRMAAA